MPAQLAAEIKALVEKAFSAFNRKDGPTFKSIFAGDAVIVDGFAPFRWAGGNTADRWWSDVETWGEAGGVLKEELVLDAVRHCDVQETRAYAVLSATLTITLKTGEAIVRPGTLVYTYAKAGDTWKADTQAWGRLG